MLVVPATAAFADASISVGTGPLTDITVTPDLNCAVNHTGDSDGEFYGSTACGTLVAVGGTLYGPEGIPAGGSASPRTTFTPVSQTGPTGAGTGSNPFVITTVVDLGTSGIRLTETDSYVSGEESYKTTVSLKNNGGGSVTPIVYRAGDCFLQDSDVGDGSVTAVPAGHAVTCVADSGRIEQWFPLTPGSHYLEDNYNTVWAAIGSQTAFPDTCQCGTQLDNGAGLSWSSPIGAGGTLEVSHLTVFSPLGIQPLTTTKTADTGSVPASAPDAYTITVSNPNSSIATIDGISDTLPAGFTYAAGSTTGATTGNPSAAGQTLTWSGPFDVPAASGPTPGTLSLHFGVTVSGTPGTYTNQASGVSASLTIVGTGPTAGVTVTPAETSTSSSSTSTSSSTTSTTGLSTPTSSTVDPSTSSTSTTVRPTTTSSAVGRASVAGVAVVATTVPVPVAALPAFTG